MSESPSLPPASLPPASSPPVVPGAVHRVEVARRDAQGRGIATLGRRELRVRNALPGEVVAARLEHVGRHVATARIVEVVHASKDRVPDACPHGQTCPGCGLRTTSLRARLEGKRARVLEALAAAGLPGTEVEPTVASPSEDGWRHKAYLITRRTGKGILLGLFAQGTHHLLGVEGCLAHAPAVERALDGARRAVRETDPPIYDERFRTGWLRAVAVRASASDGSALVTLVARSEGGPEGRALAAAIQREAPHVVGVVLNVHGEAGNAPFGPDFRAILGRPHLEEHSGGYALRVSAGSFFQVNPALGGTIHERIRLLAREAPAGHALDLYGGVGATAVRLAADGRTVTLVEADGPAAADARHNLRDAPGAEVVLGRAEDVLASLPNPAVVVVNPPRSGLAAPVTQALARLGPPRLLYVSCDPATLARDLALLAAGGGRIRFLTPYDLLPQTPHVEALALVEYPPR